jgi:hypothetical protein
MDPQMQQELEALRTEKYASLNALAGQYGYTDYKEAINAHVAVNELMAMETDYDNQIGNLASSYNEEFWGRYRTTYTETIQRLMDNAEAMK